MVSTEGSFISVTNYTRMSSFRYSTLSGVRLESTFSAMKSLRLWVSEPLPRMAETVLFMKPPSLCEAGLPGGSVTLVKSNAKALLTLRIKSALALSEGERGVRRGLGALPMAYRPHGRNRSVSRSCQWRRTNGFTNGSRQASRCFRGKAAAPVHVRLLLRRFCTA